MKIVGTYGTLVREVRTERTRVPTILFFSPFLAYSTRNLLKERGEAMDDFMLNEAIFVFLHGPKAYPEEMWEPILLEVLLEVGFNAGVLNYSECLFHSHTVGTRHASSQEPKYILFGVRVNEEDDPNSNRNVEAESWLEEIATRMTGLRVGYLIRKQSPEEARDCFRETVKILSAGGSVDAHAEERESIARDPNSYSEYEAMRQNPPDGFESFETFFVEAQVKLAEWIQKSKPLEPILLTEEGDFFVQITPPGLLEEHLRDEMILAEIHGLHRICGGTIHFVPTTKTRIACVCKKCNLRISLPSSAFTTLWHLRERGELLGQR